MKRAAIVSLFVLACGGSARFALRAPVLHDTDDTPLAHAPKNNQASDLGESVDVLLFGPIARFFAVRVTHEAANINSLDEVADSAWFTNRGVVTPEAIEHGPCPTFDPTPPFDIHHTKIGGVTPGFIVHDAQKHKYVLKLDELGKYGQTEISTAADAISSRLYWAAGFNAPCNVVIDVAPDALRVDAHAKQEDAAGRTTALTKAALATIMKQATRNKNGTFRMSASLFISGEGVGTWRTEGVRGDDPNDVVPHEDRRELRGEKLLAGWTAHWDSRGLNTYDTYMNMPGGGYVLHYFLDFSDSLGGTVARTKWPEPRAGYESAISLGNIATDAVGFGFVHRPWDYVHTDPRYPNLGFLDAAHYDPYAFSPQTPLVRWARASKTDLAWMARHLARIGLAQVRAAVHTGRLSNPAEEARLVEIMMQRRDRTLRASFTDVSPLADVMLRDGRVCFVDLARETGISTDTGTSYAAEFRFGSDLRLAPVAPRIARTDTGLCVELPASFAPRQAARDSADRYATVDVVRFEGHTHTRLRAHFYDLGAAGYVLVGIERI